MKLSLRTEKLNSQNFDYRIDHNSRVTFSKSADSSKSKNNINFTSEHFQNSLENLWDYIRADFDEKKSKNLIPKNKRFLKRNSTKATKDKNGNKTFSQTETSIAREFVIQLGSEKEGFFSDEDSQRYYEQIQNFIAEKYKLTVLKSDLHLDEAVPHLHIIATSYSFKTGEFSKEFNKKNSYEAMQREVFRFCIDELKIDLEGYDKKECLGADYIAPAVYKREKETIQKAQEFCKNKDSLEKQLISARETILSQKASIDTQKDVLKRYEQDMNELELQNKELKAKVSTLEDKVEKLKSEIFKLKQELKQRSNMQQHQKVRKQLNTTEKSLKSTESELSSLISTERSEIDIREVEQFITDSTGTDRRKAREYLRLREEFEKFKDRPDWQEAEEINIKELEQELLEAEQELLEAGFKPTEKNKVYEFVNTQENDVQNDEILNNTL